MSCRRFVRARATSGGEGADDRSRSDAVRGPGDEQGERDRGRDEHPANACAPDPADQTPAEGNSEQEGDDEESDREGNRARRLWDRDAARLGDLADHGEDHEAEDVVDDGGSENDLAFACLEDRQLREHSRGDPDRGRGQRGSDEDRRQRRKAEATRDDPAAGERQSHARERDAQSRRADAQEFVQVGLQANFEEEQDHADLGHEKHALRKRNQPEDGGSQQDSDEELAQHRRLAHALGELPEELRPDERRGKSQEEGGGGFPVVMRRDPSECSFRRPVVESR
jgi:hypothetical protein